MPSGLPGAHGEHDDRVGDDALVLVARPVLVHEAGVDEPRDVGLERECDEVGREAGLDGAALVAGGRVRLLEVDALAGGRLLEGGDDLLVRLARGGVGDERELVESPPPEADPPQGGGDKHEREPGQRGHGDGDATC